jgi:hypothetical protein
LLASGLPKRTFIDGINTLRHNGLVVRDARAPEYHMTGSGHALYEDGADGADAVRIGAAAPGVLQGENAGADGARVLEGLAPSHRSPELANEVSHLSETDSIRTTAAVRQLSCPACGGHAWSAVPGAAGWRRCASLAPDRGPDQVCGYEWDSEAAVEVDELPF